MSIDHSTMPLADDEIGVPDDYANLDGEPDIEPDINATSIVLQFDRLDTRLALGSDVEIARIAAAHLTQRHGEVAFAEGKYWRWRGTHWKSIDDHNLRLAIHKFDGVPFGPLPDASAPEGNGRVRRAVKQTRIKLGRDRINSILNELAAILAKPDFFAASTPGINCQTGFIKFTEDGIPTLEQHDPRHRCRHVLPGRWPLVAQPTGPTLLDKLLEGCFRNDPDASRKKDLIAEITGCSAVGYATKLIQPKGVVFVGATANNGKSQVLDMIRGLLPSEAVTSIPLDKIGDDKYCVHLSGKLLNAADELTDSTNNPYAAIASARFKQVITGNTICSRDVYKSAVEFKAVAQHIFACNTLPSWKGGMDRGVRRRLLVVHFDGGVSNTEKICDIGARIAIEEADLLLDFAVKGASRLIARREYPSIESSDEALDEWVSSDDPVMSWLANDVTVTGRREDLLRVSNAYQAFRSYCKAAGYQEPTLPHINAFSARVEASGKGIGRIRRSDGSNFSGIKI